jgi:acyl carrier protein
MNLDWARLAAMLPGIARSRWASRIVSAPAEERSSGFLYALREAPPGSRRALITAHIQEEVGRIMRLDGPADPRRKLFEMGMDSLMALELKSRLQHELGASVPVTAVFNHPTIEALAGHLLDDVLGLEAHEAGDRPAPVPPESVLERVKRLSDEEAGRLLSEKLAAEGAAL